MHRHVGPQPTNLFADKNRLRTVLASFYPGVRVNELGMGVFRGNGVPETNESSSSRFWDVGVILSQLFWCMKFSLDYLQQLWNGQGPGSLSPQAVCGIRHGTLFSTLPGSGRSLSTDWECALSLASVSVLFLEHELHEARGCYFLLFVASFMPAHCFTQSEQKPKKCWCK